MSKISQSVVKLLFGDGKIAHENLKWDIEMVVGPDPDFITRCVLYGITWPKLEPGDRTHRFRSEQQFNAKRSAKIKGLRVKLAFLSSSLIDIRSFPIPQRSFSISQVEKLLHITPGRWSNLCRTLDELGADERLVEQLKKHHMPARPMLIDILLNTPVTIQEALDMIERHWHGWSSERRQFMATWSRDSVEENGYSRQVWSSHKLAILSDLNIPRTDKRVNFVLRWPDVWAWRGLVCGQGRDTIWQGQSSLLYEVGKQQEIFGWKAEQITRAIDKLT